MQRFKTADLYTKIPTDLTEATIHGSFFSICSLTFMGFLFFVELTAFLGSSISTKVAMDPNNGSQLRINFNITLPDLHCDYVRIDLRDAIGTNVMNMTKNIEKWQLDSDGSRRMYQGRNREMYAFEHEDHHPEIGELHENGEHAKPLTAEEFPAFTEAHEFSFINFYAPWCIWCQRMEPTWEVFAEQIEEQEQPVAVAKVDCVANQALCAAQKVQAFPTLRFFRHGDPVNQGDYRSDRTVPDLMNFVQRKLELENQYKEWPEARQAHAINWNTDHPGCLVSGFLLVNRVPGNFHIEAASKNHNLNPPMTNVSHIVNHLSFGIPLNEVQEKRLDSLDIKYHNVKPLDATEFITSEFHQAYHHYIKVVSTNYILGRRWRNRFMAFQMLPTNQIMHYPEADVPEARFTYDISPMSVVVTKEGRLWYDFVTSVCGIIGGTFVTIGLVSSGVGNVIGKKHS